MDQTVEPPATKYVIQAAIKQDISLNTDDVEDQLKIFEAALGEMVSAISDIRGDGRLDVSFLNKDIRPDLKYIRAKLNRISTQPKPPTILGGNATIDKALQHLNLALSHLNTAVRMHDLGIQSGDYKHSFGFEDGADQCEAELRKARDQLRSGS